MITLENVSKSYAKGQPALNDVSLHIDKGEFVFIVGNSGSGKSTLIKLLLKELEPTSGTIIVNDQNLGKMKRRKVPKYRRGVGVVFQDFRLLKDRNVYENLRRPGSICSSFLVPLLEPWLTCSSISRRVSSCTW